MNGFYDDAKIVANKIYEELLKKDNKQLTVDEIIDIYETIHFPIFRKTEFYIYKILMEKSDVEKVGYGLKLK